MIECTFAHLSDVREKGETRLWNTNIRTWKELIAHSSTHPHFTKKVWSRARSEVIKLQEALERQDFDYIANQIYDGYHWRMIPNLWGKILYLDVEMTGLDLETDVITTIACYTGNEIRYFIRGVDLPDFVPFLNEFDAICTFDGEKGDLPFLNKAFGIHIDHIHFDLFKLSRRLHMHGGLKDLEVRFNLSREDLTGITGKLAIVLWNRYLETHEQKYLDTLIAYNIEDVLHLDSLLQIFYNLLKREYRLPARLMDETITLPTPPVLPDAGVLKEMLDLLAQMNEEDGIKVGEE
ncbi:MAG: ribonuclease H-like domain-containing protein [Promethearchaeota archaeon]